MTNDKIYEVRAIENGTVIDHIPNEVLFMIINIMKLDKESEQVTFGMNLESKRMGRKAIIKIHNRYCQPEEINRMALVAPEAKVNIIKDYKVIEKLHISLPERVEGYVKCGNPKCITNNEEVKTSFRVIKREQIALRCKYCEKTTYQKEMVLLK